MSTTADNNVIETVDVPQIPSSQHPGLEFPQLEIGDRVIIKELGTEVSLHLYRIHPRDLVKSDVEITDADISDWENPDVVPAILMGLEEVDGVMFGFYTSPTGSGWSSTYKMLKVKNLD